MTRPIAVRRLTSPDEFKAVQHLERTVWGMDPIPIHQTLTAVKNGGILIGSFDGDRLVGFCYAFPGFDGKRTYLCSHMMGVAPSYRGMGLGKRMKWAQREWALSRGYSLITWTYDPLESVNASLNLNALRAICSTYVENCYGEMDDVLNRGLPTDRFQVEWWLDSPHVTNPAPPPTTMGLHRRVCDWSVNSDGMPQLPENVEQTLAGAEHFPDGTDSLLVPIPVRFQHIKSRDPVLARDWRMKTRTIFQALFSKGYAATGTLRQSGEPVHYYVLQQRERLRIDASAETEKGDKS